MSNCTIRDGGVPQGLSVEPTLSAWPTAAGAASAKPAALPLSVAGRRNLVMVGSAVDGTPSLAGASPSPQARVAACRSKNCRERTEPSLSPRLPPLPWCAGRPHSSALTHPATSDTCTTLRTVLRA